MSRVLLIDDDAGALEIRKQIFELHGHLVSSADNAIRARQQFLAHSPSNVILDLRLPGVEDGLALIREFRSASPGVNIVVLAGWPADLDGRREKELVNRVVSKPARSEVLLNAISQRSGVH
jgi:DNA-binding NtrC family response regulator